MHVASRLHNGTATFNRVQILDLACAGVDIFIENIEYCYVHYVNNTQKIISAHPKNLAWAQSTTVCKGGLYYYWYTIPLVNYYHTLLDGVGALTHYMRLREQNPDVVLLLNRTPRA